MPPMNSNFITAMQMGFCRQTISPVTRKIDFSNMFIALDGNHYTTLEVAREATSAISA